MTDSAASFYWHDYETFGTHPALDRPVQFAGLRTDADFNPIGEPLVIYCRPAEDYLPQPDACLVTGITPQKALEAGVREAEFVARIHAELAHPGTCGLGYNSLRFDDEVTRHALYRNFHDPYAREWQHGNSRWDLIDVLRMARALRPEGIHWPRYDDGTPSMRLEDLTRANNLPHEGAHDALADVYATLALARLLRERQPRLFAYGLQLRDKHFAAAQLDLEGMKPVLHFSARYPQSSCNGALVVPLARHPVNRNAIIVWNLAQDPAPLLEDSPESLRARLYRPATERPPEEAPLALKQVHLNRSPMLAPVAMVREDSAARERMQLDGELSRTHLGKLRAAVEGDAGQALRAKVADIFTDPQPAEPLDPELMLYRGGFFSRADREAMAHVRQASPRELAENPPSFKDERLPELLFRYRARNFPDTLNPEEGARWEAFRRQRLLEDPLPGTLGFEAFYARLNERAQETAEGGRARGILEDLALYAEAIYPVC